MTIVHSTSQIIDQLIGVINQLSANEYMKPLKVYNGSTIGKHFRHIYDFYACLIDGCGKGTIDYCNRKRVELLENNPKTIVGCFEEIKKEIHDLDMNEALEVYGDFQFDNGERPISQSSVGRELLYAYDHAVHHLAIVKMGIRSELPNIKIDNTIGIAASTLRHLNSHS